MARRNPTGSLHTIMMLEVAGGRRSSVVSDHHECEIPDTSRRFVKSEPRGTSNFVRTNEVVQTLAMRAIFDLKSAYGRVFRLEEGPSV